MGDQMALPAGFTLRVFGTADRDDVRASVASFGYESASAGSAEMRFGALPPALDALLSSVTTERYLVPSYVTRRVYITQQNPITARRAVGDELDAAFDDDLFEAAREASSVMDALQRIRDDPDGAWSPVDPAEDDARAFRRRPDARAVGETGRGALSVSGRGAEARTSATSRAIPRGVPGRESTRLGGIERVFHRGGRLVEFRGDDDVRVVVVAKTSRARRG